MLLQALQLGAAYALVTLGFTLILNASRAVNFAQGDLVMLGGMVSAQLGNLTGLFGWALLPGIVIGMAGLGVLLGWLLFLPLKERHPSSTFIATIALGLILQNIALALFGPGPQAAPPFFPPEVNLFSLQAMNLHSASVILLTILLFLLVYLCLYHTQWGRRMRAAAQDQEMAKILGLPVKWLLLSSIALGTTLAGIAGLFLSHRYFVTPLSGLDLMLKIYVAATIGGWGRLSGAALGGLLVAAFETFVTYWLSDSVATALLFLSLIGLLLWRREGLFGEREGQRA